MSEEINKFPQLASSSQFIPYISKEEINGMVSSLANTISKKYENEDLIVIGILKGSTFFLADLVRQIRNVNLLIDFALFDSVGRTKEEVGTIRIKQDIKSNVRGKNVLIVQEILQSGRAATFLRDRLMISKPRNVEMVTLFNKPYQRVTDFSPSFIGKEIDDHFVIGYGLDLDQYGRNFKEVYYLKYPN
ncbi:phosphoribosyltransferase family protein [Bacteriovoracaceae bacterium]|nr:phosphoribosyltransferase family protein [Bacteriovoracaceae bacterium]